MLMEHAVTRSAQSLEFLIVLGLGAGTMEVSVWMQFPVLTSETMIVTFNLMQIPALHASKPRLQLGLHAGSKRVQIMVPVIAHLQAILEDGVIRAGGVTMLAGL